MQIGRKRGSERKRHAKIYSEGECALVAHVCAVAAIVAAVVASAPATVAAATKAQVLQCLQLHLKYSQLIACLALHH